MATIRDIAEVAGVSISTVSLALRNSTRISAETRERLQALARQMRYLPPGRLGEPHGKNSRLIGCVIHSMFDPIFARIVGGMHLAAYERGYNLMVIEGMWFTPYRLDYGLDAFFEHKVDGMILIPTGPATREMMLEIQSRNIRPLFALCQDATLPVDTVTVNTQQAAACILDYLAMLGHRRLGYLERVDVYPFSLRTLLLEMATARGMTVLPFDDVSSSDPHAVVHRLQRTDPRLTALIYQNDEDAMQLLHAAPAHGLRIPDDLSVIGCGDTYASQMTTPALTTVEIHSFTIGRHAVERLLDRLSGTLAHDAPPIHETVPVQLIRRDSCRMPGPGIRRSPEAPPGVTVTGHTRADAILATLRDGLTNRHLYCTSRTQQIPEHPEFWGWLSTDDRIEWHTEHGAIHLGSVDRHWVHIDPTTIVAYLNSDTPSLPKSSPRSLRDILDALEAKGVIRVSYDAGRRTRTWLVRLGGQVKRMITLSREALVKM